MMDTTTGDDVLTAQSRPHDPTDPAAANAAHRSVTAQIAAAADDAGWPRCYTLDYTTVDTDPGTILTGTAHTADDAPHRGRSGYPLLHSVGLYDPTADPASPIHVPSYLRINDAPTTTEIVGDFTITGGPRQGTIITFDTYRDHVRMPNYDDALLARVDYRNAYALLGDYEPLIPHIGERPDHEWTYDPDTDLVTVHVFAHLIYLGPPTEGIHP